jgi:hypothetical protein
VQKEVAMRGSVLVSTLAMVLAGVGIVDACGDKFLLVGRGLAFGRAYASVYPGSILIYGQPASKSQVDKLQQSIRKAGHRVAVVNTPADLSAKLLLQQTDIVIADVAVKSDLDQQVATMATRPSVLYLVTEAAKGRTAIPQDSASVIKSGEKPGRFLVVLEDIMKTRQQAGVRVKKG